MTNLKPPIPEMVSTYKSTEHWINQYLAESIIFLKSENITDLRNFRQEIWDFLHAIESEWINQTSFTWWLWGNGIRKGYQKLRELDMKIARVIEDLKRDQVIKQGMKKAPLPDEASQPNDTRNISEWNQSPKRYSKLTKEKIKVARLPERMGG